jgi:hypothetical protein
MTQGGDHAFSQAAGCLRRTCPSDLLGIGSAARQAGTY